jgi:hypothetical protein
MVSRARPRQMGLERHDSGRHGRLLRIANQMRIARGMDPMPSIEIYRARSLPVIEKYAHRVYVEDEPYESVAHEFISRYAEAIPGCRSSTAPRRRAGGARFRRGSALSATGQEKLDIRKPCSGWAATWSASSAAATTLPRQGGLALRFCGVRRAPERTLFVAT